MRLRYPKMQNQMVDREDSDHNIIPGAWRKGTQMRDSVMPGTTYRTSNEAKAQRNLLKHWVSSPVGRLQWQDRMI